MKIPKSIALVVIGVIAGATIATGATIAAGVGSGNTPVTYYACLTAKRTLSKVGTTAPKCGSQATLISWNSVGPQGPAGPPGAGSESTHANLVSTMSGYMGPVTLSLPSGAYVVSFAIFNGGGNCSYAGSTNVTMTTPFDGGELSALISVGTGGGSLTLGCEANGIPGGGPPGALLTAVPTATQ